MPIMMSLGLMLMGAALMLAFWSGFRASRRGHLYEQTEGTLVKAWVEAVHDGDSRDQYSAKAAYDYSVKGRRYRGRYISFPERSSWTKQEAEEKLLPIQAAHDKLVVWFDPDEPSMSCLVKTSSTVAAMPVVLGAVFLVSGLLGWVLGS